MKLVGLTGGIGSGKSTVSRLLADRGAVVIDADDVARELQAPGSPMVKAMADEFGAAVLNDDGSLDRAAVAALVFGDSAEARANLKKLNSVTHPAIRDEIQARIDAERDGDAIVILDHPLLAEPAANPMNDATWRADIDAIVVVDVPAETQVERLIGRGMEEADARRRIASQVSRDERLALATFVVDNAGDLAALERELERLWPQLVALVGD